jgi:hypothetical protein
MKYTLLHANKQIVKVLVVANCVCVCAWNRTLLGMKINFRDLMEDMHTKQNSFSYIILLTFVIITVVNH